MRDEFHDLLKRGSNNTDNADYDVLDDDDENVNNVDVNDCALLERRKVMSDDNEFFGEKERQQLDPFFYQALFNNPTKIKTHFVKSSASSAGSCNMKINNANQNCRRRRRTSPIR